MVAARFLATVPGKAERPLRNRNRNWTRRGAVDSCYGKDEAYHAIVRCAKHRVQAIGCEQGNPQLVYHDDGDCKQTAARVCTVHEAGCLLLVDSTIIISASSPRTLQAIQPVGHAQGKANQTNRRTYEPDGQTSIGRRVLFNYGSIASNKTTRIISLRHNEVISWCAFSLFTPEKSY